MEESLTDEEEWEETPCTYEQRYESTCALARSLRDYCQEHCLPIFDREETQDIIHSYLFANREQ